MKAKCFVRVEQWLMIYEDKTSEFIDMPIGADGRPCYNRERALATHKAILIVSLFDKSVVKYNEKKMRKYWADMVYQVRNEYLTKRCLKAGSREGLKTQLDMIYMLCERMEESNKVMEKALKKIAKDFENNESLLVQACAGSIAKEALRELGKA